MDQLPGSSTNIAENHSRPENVFPIFRKTSKSSESLHAPSRGRTSPKNLYDMNKLFKQASQRSDILNKPSSAAAKKRSRSNGNSSDNEAESYPNNDEVSQVPKKPSRAPQQLTPPPTRSPNKYDALANDTEDGEEAEPNTSPKETINSPQNGKSSSVRPPPIHVTETSFTAVSQILKDLPDLKNQFTFKKKSDNEFTFYLKTMTAFYKLKDKLTRKKLKYFTYTPKHLKYKNIVLKGICGDYTTDDIKEEIASLDLPNICVIKIINLKFKSTGNNFLLQLSHNSDINPLKKVKSLLFKKIRWEPLRKKAIYQCKNCQRLGHSSTNCQLGYRCVKCGKSHNPGECTIPKDCTDRSKLYCINCEQHGHPASYRGCPFYKFALNQVTESKSTIPLTNRLNSTKKYVNDLISKNIAHTHSPIARPHLNAQAKSNKSSTTCWSTKSGSTLFADPTR
ncbi:hypothetical protein TKK_0012250 [Trichogramma kaykai]